MAFIFKTCESCWLVNLYPRQFFYSCGVFLQCGTATSTNEKSKYMCTSHVQRKNPLVSYYTVYTITTMCFSYKAVTNCQQGKYEAQDFPFN